MEQHLSQYKIFYAVAKAGNISKAAKELFISQPAISKSISKLEENLGRLIVYKEFQRGSAYRGGTGPFQPCQQCIRYTGAG